MLSVDATRSRAEDGDHMNQDMEAESSGGNGISRMI